MVMVALLFMAGGLRRPGMVSQLLQIIVWMGLGGVCHRGLRKSSTLTIISSNSSGRAVWSSGMQVLFMLLCTLQCRHQEVAEGVRRQDPQVGGWEMKRYGRGGLLSLSQKLLFLRSLQDIG
jgi:hypothetical protein